MEVGVTATCLLLPMALAVAINVEVLSKITATFSVIN